MARCTPLRLIAPPESLPALPDGLRPMPGGKSVIVAYYNPAHVADGIAQEIRLSDGEVLTEFVIPGSPRVTCPEVWELDGATCVFFTTAIEGMPRRDARHRAGSRYDFRCGTGCIGRTIMNLNRRDFIVAPAATVATSLLFAADPAVPWQRKIRRLGQTEHDRARSRRCSTWSSGRTTGPA